MRKGLLIIACLQLMLSSCGGSANNNGGVAEKRMEHLQKGINICYLFWTYKIDDTDRTSYPYVLDRPEERITEEDFIQIRKAGFDHVRIPVDYSNLAGSGNPQELNGETIGRLKELIELCTKQDLAVILDLHNISSDRSEGGSYSSGLESGDLSGDQFVDFWEAVALAFADTDPDLVFFEILNEPGFSGREEEWYALQRRVIKILGITAPERTILASVPHMNHYQDLIRMEPYRLDNIIYTFHFYEPGIFTHQGTSWSPAPINTLSGIPYPAGPSVMEDMAEQENNPMLKGFYTIYGKGYWDSVSVENCIAQVARWSELNGVPVMCTEFGAYKGGIDQESRMNWYGDVVKALDEYGIGWTVWEYDCPEFGIFEYDGNGLTANSDMLKSLGL